MRSPPTAARRRCAKSRFIGGLTDEAIEQQFRFARQRDYLELAKEARRHRGGAVQGGRRLPAKRRAQVETALARDFASALEEIVAHRLLRRARPRSSSIACCRPPRTSCARRAPADPKCDARRAVAAQRSRADLGDAQGDPRRSHRQRLADPALHRSGGQAQVRRGEGLRAGARRAALRHVRRRVHARGRAVHVRGPARAAGAPRTRRCATSPTWSTTSTYATTSSGARRRAASPRSSPASASSTAKTTPGSPPGRPCSTPSTARSSSEAASRAPDRAESRLALRPRGRILRPYPRRNAPCT